MADDVVRKAADAFIDEEFGLAVDLYTKALAMEPKNADLFVKRAKANIKLNNFTDAIDDANKAIQLDPSLSKAYLQKGIACMALEEYETAKASLTTGFSLDSDNLRFKEMIKECNKQITVELNGLGQKSVPNGTSGSLSSSTGSATIVSDAGIVQTRDQQPTPVVAAKPKYRCDYYQNANEVVVSIYAKGIPSNCVIVDFGEQILSVSIELPGQEPYHFQHRLFAKIDRTKCRYEVLLTKIEIRLSKVERVNWSSLEYRKDTSTPYKLNTTSEIKSVRPAYPSSRRSTDWDKVEAEVKREEKEEKLDGDAAVNKLFREIYRDADDDAKRAMQKSFLESNGTVLSTNWKEVGTKKVEGSPPDGMELKKWEY
ncbi:hypothetical protein AMTRI_Chr01g109260 [Amborella trichopoda]